MGFNRAQIGGEVKEVKRFGGDGKKEKLELRVDDGKLNHTVVVWEPTQYPKVGDSIVADGRIGYRSFDGRDGSKKWVTEIVLDADGLQIAAAKAIPAGGLSFED